MLKLIQFSFILVLLSSSQLKAQALDYHVIIYECLKGCKKAYISGIKKKGEEGYKIVHVKMNNSSKSVFAIVTFEKDLKQSKKHVHLNYPQKEEPPKEEDLSVPGMEDLEDEVDDIKVGANSKDDGLSGFLGEKENSKNTKATKQSFDSLISLHSSQISRCRKMYTVYGRDYFKPVPVTLVVGNDGEVNQSFIEGEAKDSALASCFKGILKKFKFSKSKAPVSLKSTLP